MNREEVKALLPVIQAFAEGKTIEMYLECDNKWKTCFNPTFNPENKYRIKPEPKYRPFDEGYECFEEMKKHEPFGWVKLEGAYRTVASIQENYLHIDTELRHFESMFTHATFADGTPFGIKEGGEE